MTSTIHPRLAVSEGDPAGIGPEIIIKTLAMAPELNARCEVHGSAPRFAKLAESLGLPAPANINASTHLPETEVIPSVPGAHTGELAYRSVVSATQSVMRGDCSAIITAPLSKHAMNLAGHRYPGHTELLAELAGNVPVRMMLANPELRVILVTVHKPLRAAIEALSTDGIIETLHIAHESLSRILPHPPRLAVAGLNPHAGEGGMLGREEIEIIEPAIRSAVAAGIDASGPYPPDTIFMQARGLQTFDAVIAMYHDQGLIPVKYLGVEEGVNITLGLPFVRTSPDHGTAFDIAGKGIADPASMLNAIRMADRLLLQWHK